LLDIWQARGRAGAMNWVLNYKPDRADNNRNNFKWLDGNKDINEYLQIHRNMRKLVREDAAKLG
jgi:predicted HAD superfamily phosphohydrolase